MIGLTASTYQSNSLSLAGLNKPNFTFFIHWHSWVTDFLLSSMLELIFNCRKDQIFPNLYDRYLSANKRCSPVHCLFIILHYRFDEKGLKLTVMNTKKIGFLKRWVCTLTGGIGTLNILAVYILFLFIS